MGEVRTRPYALRLAALPLLAALIVVGGAAGSTSRATAQRPAEAVPGELIVGFKADVSEGEQQAILARVGAASKRTFRPIRAVHAGVPAERTEAVLKQLANDPRVRYVERNYLVSADTHLSTPNDPSFHELWGMHNFGQTVNGDAGSADADIDALEAWAGGTRIGSPNVVVSVIDTGVDYDHPDLAGTQWINPGENCGSSDPAITCEQRTNGVDDDVNGYVDDYRGWDFYNNDNNPFDDHGHGTHVSGTIGAVGNNGIGVTGVNWGTAKIMALKFLGAGGSGSTSAAVSAVLYAGAKGAHVSNNSWGGGGFSQALLDAINTAGSQGMLFVAAAGNSGLDTDATPNYPSGYDSPYIVAVAATDNDDNKASFSNYGKVTVDLGAPGVNVYSTKPGNSYQYLSGTSMATPHVAGTAALVKSLFPGATPFGIEADLFRTVDANASLNGKTATNGRLNANTAVSCLDAPRAWILSPRPGFGVAVGGSIQIKVIGASCASPAGLGNVGVAVNGTPIAVSAASPDTALYTGSWTASAEGTVTVTATVTAGGTVDTQTSTGTAAPNYTCEATTYSWDDPTLGTNTGLGGDDVSKTVALPFSFAFYGASYSSATVSSNGFLELGSSAGSTAYANTGIPNASAPNGLVAPFWDDLVTGSGGVYTRTIGDAPSRRFVVGWVNVPHYSNVGAATFEAILYEGTNEIRFQYQDTDFGSSSYNAGAEATSGVENQSGSMGTQWSFNQAVLAGETATRCFFSAGAGPTVTTSSLADASVGLFYSQTLTATGGTSYTWSIESGSLPLGLALDLDPSTGVISGTPTPDASGAAYPITYAFTVGVMDSTLASSTRALSISVGKLEITTTSMPGATAGQVYSQPLAAQGGSTPYSWSVVSGSLPLELVLSPSTGTISGTPTAAGTYLFTARVTDSASPARTDQQALSILIQPGLSITTFSPLLPCKVGSCTRTIQAVGGTTPYTWAIVSGSLPAELSLNSSTGTISGTPTKPGNYNFTVQVTDRGSPALTATKAFSLKINKK